jgi:hypothetical protein
MYGVHCTIIMASVAHKDYNSYSYGSTACAAAGVDGSATHPVAVAVG